MAGTPLPCEQWFLYEGPERDHCERPFASLIEPLSSAMDEYIKQVKALGHLLSPPRTTSVGEKWMRDKGTPKDVCGEATYTFDCRRNASLLRICFL